MAPPAAAPTRTKAAAPPRPTVAKPESWEQFSKGRGIEAAPYDSDRFKVAHGRLLNDPVNLTDADVQTFAGVTPQLADLALAKRAGFVDPADQHPDVPVMRSQFFEFFELWLGPVLQTHRLRGSNDKAAIAALDARLAALEGGTGARVEAASVMARLEALEARPAGLAYKGIWDAAITYRLGEFVTRSGSIWHCELDSSRGVPPGTGPHWKLACKKGADGRDASKETR